MQLTIRELADLLNVPERTIRGWIKSDNLPFNKIHRTYGFNRFDILEWASSHQIRVSAQLFDRPGEQNTPSTKFTAALKAGGIFYNLVAATKEEALHALVDVMPLPDKVDRQSLLELFVARETLASTGIGDGIAIPHIRNPVVLDVPHPLITLCFLHNPVPFDASDGKPVGALFSMITSTARVHCRVLARLSCALHDPQFKDAILRTASRDEILREARRVEDDMECRQTPISKLAG